ncbi:reverse transcriptase family protein [Pseudofrancisella aestuarii]|uniref:Reverse transcriptase family protein n=1 Tax=Pseudofrancisella aestuarii TaxID=2670347 RepID=A0ABV9TCK2_9GAMM|nr:reverse transcriptase family protein [Pseudofrancisella aestuarii]
MKKYSIDQSPIYKLSSKKKLKEILYIDEKKLKQATQFPAHYSFNKKINGKTRNIQPPINITKKIHERILSLLSRIEVHTFLFSGVKGRSYVCNARKHIASSFFLTIDIKNFFPSTTRKKVFYLFYKMFKCSPDIADTLAKMLTFNNQLVQGSCVSQLLSYLSNYEMFEEINIIANKYNLTFSLYVDDMTFSSSQDFKKSDVIYEIKKILKKSDYQIKRSKLRYSKTGDITGVIIKESHLLVKNKTHRKVFLLREEKNLKKIKQLTGQAKYIQPSFPKKPKLKPPFSQAFSHKALDI